MKRRVQSGRFTPDGITASPISLMERLPGESADRPFDQTVQNPSQAAVVGCRRWETSCVDVPAIRHRASLRYASLRQPSED